MNLRGHIMSLAARAVLDAADIWAAAVEQEAAAQGSNQKDEDAVNASTSAEVDLLAAVQRWRQEGRLSQ
jgi:hypothetical protein